MPNFLKLVDIEKTSKEDSKKNRIYYGQVIEVPRASDNIPSISVEGLKRTYWVKLDSGAVRQVYSRKINVYKGLYVEMRRRVRPPQRLEITDFDDVKSDAQGLDSSPLLAAHASDHIGTLDPLYLPMKNNDEFRVTLTTSLSVKIRGGRYYSGTQIRYFDETEIDLASYQPDVGTKRYVLVQVSREFNIVVVATGDAVPVTSPFTPFPERTSSLHIPCAFVLLRNQTDLDYFVDYKEARSYEFGGSSGLPNAQAVGQVLFSIDGSMFTAQTPLTGEGGWLVNEHLDGTGGELLVVDEI